jgi:pimeloyl-ACP methyl ester carboxylesterase
VIATLFAVALHLSPCTIAGASARCGTFDVPESAGSNRTLHLNLVVLPATERNESPIFPFGGGPGEKVTPGGEMVVKELTAERRLHDIVLLDERGTEGSALCPNAVKAHAREAIESDLFPPGLVADCRKEVEKNADPTRYTLDYFADDVEALRNELGYGPINIIGLSYGTRAALTFEARHPASVRSIVMYGPLPPDNRTPLNFARDAQSVMERIMPLGVIQKALAKLPVDVKSGGYTIHMTRGAFTEYLRSKLYAFETQKQVPEIVRQVAAGDWKKIAPDFIAYRKRWFDDLGVFLSVTCPTDVRQISSLEIGPTTARTFGGDYRTSRQLAACAAWTPGLVEPLKVSRANVPILVFVGDRDAVTPPRWANLLATEAPRVHVIVLPNASHQDLSPCALGIETVFFDAGSFEKLDESCVHKDE